MFLEIIHHPRYTYKTYKIETRKVSTFLFIATLTFYWNLNRLSACENFQLLVSIPAIPNTLFFLAAIKKQPWISIEHLFRTASGDETVQIYGLLRKFVAIPTSDVFNYTADVWKFISTMKLIAMSTRFISIMARPWWCTRFSNDSHSQIVNRPVFGANGYQTNYLIGVNRWYYVL